MRNGDLTGDITPYTIPSETNVAESIRAKLGANAIDNIDIYQMSHHGHNNNKTAIDTLNLNRENIYPIEESYVDMSTAPNWDLINTYYRTLGRIPAEKKMKVGTTNKSGAQCNINAQTGTTCEFY